MSGYFIYFFLLVVFKAIKADWELSVCLGDRVEALGANGQTLSSRSLGHSVIGVDGDPTGRLPPPLDMVLALDSLTGHLFFADSRRTNTSIYSITLGAPPGRPDPVRTIVPRASRSVTGVAFDILDQVVYWTTGRQGSIMKSHLVTIGMSAEPEVVHSFSAQVPHGIAVDSCRRKVYWSNCNVTGPSIEMSGLDGAKRQVLVETGLFQPLGLALSQGDGYLYWADEGPGYSFSIERIRLDGTERQVLVKSSQQQPIALAVVPGERIYWTDHVQQAVWRLDFTTNSSAVTASDPVIIKEYKDSAPYGLVSMKQDTYLDPLVCSNIIQLKTQVKWDRGESRLCPKDYCLHNGTCAATQMDELTCDCKTGFLGDRCQYETRLCAAYCLDTTSTTDSVLFDHCRCTEVSEVYKEVNSSLLGSTRGAGDSGATWKFSTICLGAACSLLVLVIVGLALRVHTLSKRPKLRRRYTVSKGTVGGSKRGGGVNSPGHDRTQCEIGDIENCCNMNICETPCYEPEFRTPGGSSKNSRSLEQRSLISDMEVPEPTRPPL